MLNKTVIQKIVSRCEVDREFITIITDYRRSFALLLGQLMCCAFALFHINNNRFSTLPAVNPQVNYTKHHYIND